MLRVSSLALGLSMPPQCIMLLMAPSNGLVGAGSHSAARSWVSPELAAQPAATHSRSSLRFLLRACCPGKNQGILYTSLHGVMGVNQENMMKYEKCQNVLRTTPLHECQCRDVWIEHEQRDSQWTWQYVVRQLLLVSHLHLVRDHSSSLTFRKNWFRHCDLIISHPGSL